PGKPGCGRGGAHRSLPGSEHSRRPQARAGSGPADRPRRGRGGGARMMQPLDRNLASRPFRNNTLPWPGLAALTVALLVFTWWNATSWLSVEERVQARRSMLEDV